MTNNVFETVGTRKVWKSSGGDGALTMTSLAVGAGRQGDRVDLGDLLAANSIARATWYRWYFTGKAQATGLALLNTIDIYHAWWNDDTSGSPAQPDGGVVGASDAAFATQALLNNLHPVGSVIVDSVSGATILARSGMVYIPVRYLVPVFWNNTNAILSATATDFQYWLTPVNPQVQ